MMKDDNEDDLKNKEDLHRWKAHGAGHIPLCGIFLIDFEYRKLDLKKLYVSL